MSTVSGDYFLAVMAKVNIADLTRINEAARMEIARLREKYPNDPGLEMAQLTSDTPMAGLGWFLSVERLQYLYGGVGIITEKTDLVPAKDFVPGNVSDHLRDWWIDEYPEHVSK